MKNTTFLKGLVKRPLLRWSLPLICLAWSLIAVPCGVKAQAVLDLEELEEGQVISIQWLEKPVLVYKRTPAEIAQLQANPKYDHLYQLNQQDAFFLFARTFGADMAARLKPINDILRDSSVRSLQNDALVVLGMTTRFGCYVELQQEIKVFEDPCSGAQYDLDGRITQTTQRERFHLLIPPHEIRDGKLFLLETDPDPMLVKQMMPDFSRLDMLPGAKLMELLQWNQFDLAEQQLNPEVVEYRTQTGATPLHLAAFKAPAELLKKMLDLGFDPNAATSNGTTPLDMALMRHRWENARLLVSKGANATTQQMQQINEHSKVP